MWGIENVMGGLALVERSKPNELERYLRPLGLPLEAGEWGWKDTGRGLICEWWDHGMKRASVIKPVYRYQWF